MQLLPDCIPMSAQIMPELCNYDLWQATICRDHTIATMLLCSYQARHIARAQRPLNPVHLEQNADAAMCVP